MLYGVRTQEQMSIGKHPKQDLPHIMILKFELFVCLFSCVNWVKKKRKKANVPKNIHGSKLIPNGLFGRYHDYCLPKLKILNESFYIFLKKYS